MRNHNDYVLAHADDMSVIYPLSDDSFMSHTAAEEAAKAVNRVSGGRAVKAVKYRTALRRGWTSVL